MNKSYHWIVNMVNHNSFEFTTDHNWFADIDRNNFNRIEIDGDNIFINPKYIVSVKELDND